MHREGGVPGINVADRIGTVRRGRVRVREHLLTEGRLTVFRTPVLSESNEELLIRGEAFLRGSRLAGERSVIAVIGGGNSRYVCDVFRQSLFTVDGEVREGLVGIVLSGEPGGGVFEMFEVGGCPPVADSALGIKVFYIYIEFLCYLFYDERVIRVVFVWDLCIVCL